MWLIKSDQKTDPQYGKRPTERTIEEQIHNSIIILDKPSGPKSKEIDQLIKKIFNVKKVGHHGTLDPQAIGVLPVALDNATKIMLAFSGLDKEYLGLMHLHKEVEEKILRETAKNFVGKIKQLPPVRSAVARKIREREVYFFEILEIKGRNVLFKIGCQAGTYIRKICSDIGIAMGINAHLSQLKRTKVGPFALKDSYSLDKVKKAYELWKTGDEKLLRKILIPIEYALPHLKKVVISDSAIDPICRGSPLYVGGIVRIQKNIQKEELVAIYSLKEELVALGIAKMTSKEMFKNQKGLAVKTDKVIMKIGTYPRWKSKSAISE